MTIYVTLCIDIYRQSWCTCRRGYARVCISVVVTIYNIDITLGVI